MPALTGSGQEVANVKVGRRDVEPEDVNGDGKADIILYNSATGTEYTGISNGTGTFAYTYQYWGIGKVLAR